MLEQVAPAQPVVGADARTENVYRIECYDLDGELKWVEEIPNLTTNEGRKYVLDAAIANQVSQITQWYCGIVSGSSPTLNVTDSHQTHDFTEFTGFTEAARPGPITWTNNPSEANPSSMDNGSPNEASFSINATATIGGAFLTNGSGKGTTTSGFRIYGENTFTDRSVASGDTVKVTVTLTLASA